MRMPTRNSLFIGAAAGLVGAYAMQCFRSSWNRHYASMPQHGVFGLDKEADLKSVKSPTKRFAGRTLSDKRSEQIALILHYAYGAAAGAAYSTAAETFPAARLGHGTLFGTAVWILGDEIPIALLGISNPCERSVRSHGSALAAHLIF
jgi:hypothetical protein